MKGFNQLKVNIDELMKKYAQAREENHKFREENRRLKKDLEYFENQAGEIPDIMQKNRKLLNERQKIAEKINGVIKRIEDIEK